jgi:uncharacterized protein (TIGR03437 family)
MKIAPLLCACAAVVSAQSNGVVVGAGYNLVAPVSVAPGQVITVFVTGVGNVTQKITAGMPPLPLTLGGISAKVLQASTATPVPILAVFPFNACLAGAPPPPCGTVTGVTVQIPFEIYVHIPGTLAPEVITYLQVSDAAGNTGSVLLDPKLDSIHVLRSEDTVLAADMAQRAGSGSAVVTHADGTAVSATNPAKIGERLVMYAVGLGSTDPPVKTGVASSAPAVSARGAFSLVYDYRPNAPPSPGLIINTGDPPPLPAPDFAGLTPGFVGLYQINFLILSPPVGVSACAPSRGVGANPFASVLSNLTVTLVGTTSFDGAAICVAPETP